MSGEWKVAPHNGFYVDETGEMLHSPLLEQMLRVVYKHTAEEYNEFPIGAGDAQRLRALLNRLEPTQAGKGEGDE